MITQVDDRTILKRRLQYARRLRAGSTAPTRFAAYAEPVYLFAVVTALALFPMGLFVKSALRPLLQPVPLDLLTAAALASSGMALASAGFLPRLLSPVWSDPATISFFVRGPFGSRLTLIRGTGARSLGCGLFGAALSWCGASAVTHAPGSLVAAVGWGFAVALSSAVVATGALGSARRAARLAGLALGTALTTLGLLSIVAPLRPDPATGFAGAAVASALALSLTLLLLGPLLDRIPATCLEANAELRTSAFAGLVVGDLELVSQLVSRRRWRARRRTVRFSPNLLLRIVRRDVRGLERSPGAATRAAVIVTAASAITTGTALHPLFLFFLGAAVQLTFTPWLEGFAGRAGQNGADSVEPNSTRAALLAHLAVPASLTLACSMLGLLVGQFVWPQAPPAEWTHFLLPFIALSGRLWTIGGGSAPLQASASVPTPAGDASGVVLVAWMLRGLLPLGVLAVALDFLGPSSAVFLALGTGVFALAVTVRRSN